MVSEAYTSYFEDRILSADPVELIRILYEAALGSVRESRAFLASGEILERSKSISKATAIIAELSASLDRQKGGELAGTLAELYVYLQRTLLRAHVEKSDALLEQAEQILSTLYEGWQGVGANHTRHCPTRLREHVPEPVASYGGGYGAEALAGASRGWCA